MKKVERWSQLMADDPRIKAMLERHPDCKWIHLGFFEDKEYRLIADELWDRSDP